MPKGSYHPTTEQGTDGMAEAKRRLAAILSADVAGYSRLMGDDEAATVETLTAYRKVFATYIEAHFGRVVDSPGDNLLAEFASPVEAVECAAEIQRELETENEQLEAHRRMAFRIGINLGDVIERDGALYGDGVNIAARLEALAEPGGVCISGKVFDEVRNKIAFGFDYFGEQSVKNIAEPVPAYRVILEAGGAKTPPVRTRGRAGGGIARIAAGAAVIALVAVAGAWWLLDRAGAPTADASDEALALPTGPSIAVLPFRNTGGNPDQDFFSDGITEEIIIELSRFSQLFVIGRNTSFQYKGQTVDVKEIGRALGVRYVLEGSVRRDASAIRVAAQLLDAASGEVLWGETYQGDLTAASVFSVQDDIKAKVVGTIASNSGVIARADLEAAKRKGTENLGAYECVLRAHAYVQALSPKEHASVRECLEATIDMDPDYADGWARLGWVYLDEHRFRFNPRPGSLDRALEVTRRAVELDPTNQDAHLVLATVLFHRHELDSFFAEAERTLALNPNNTGPLAGVGLYMAYAGQWERGVALVRKAAALNPVHPGWFHFAYFHDHFRKGEYAAALAEAQKINAPQFWRMHVVLAAAYAELGQMNEARAAAMEAQRLYPGDTLAQVETFYRDFNVAPELSAKIVEALRKAGLEYHAAPMTN